MTKFPISRLIKIKYWFLIPFLLAFTTDSPRSTFTIPTAAWSVTAADLNLDGDIDVVTGHNYNQNTHWSGISIIENIRSRKFQLKDSIYLYGWQEEVLCGQLDNNPKPEIIFNKQISDIEYIGIIYNNDYADTIFLNTNSNKGINYRTIGDIDNNGCPDIVYASNHGFFWTVVYNYGYHNFSLPETHTLTFPPLDIACGDLNGDGRDDVVVVGQIMEIYYSRLNGFEKTLLDQTAYKKGAAIVDFNLDGLMDIVADGSQFGTVWTNIYQNTGNEKFTKLKNIFFKADASNFLVCDFNKDNLPDIAYLSMGSMVPDTVGGIRIVYNLGNFEISSPQFIPLNNSDENYREFGCADFDGNSYPDFVITRNSFVRLQNNLEFLFNDGKGHFAAEPLGIGETSESPKTVLLTCYPNPFSEFTNIQYHVLHEARVELSVYDIRGKLIQTLINQQQKGGNYSITWHGNQNTANQNEPCIYIACLKVNGQVIQSVKLIRY